MLIQCIEIPNSMGMLDGLVNLMGLAAHQQTFLQDMEPEKCQIELTYMEAQESIYTNLGPNVNLNVSH